MTVLIISDKIEGLELETTRLKEVIEARGEETIIIDVDKFPSNLSIDMQNESITVEDDCVKFNEVTGAFIIPLQMYRAVPIRYPEDLEEEPVKYLHKLNEYRGFVEGLVEVLDQYGVKISCSVENMYNHDRKASMLQQLKMADVNVPDTLITNDPEELLDFYAKYDRIIAKSLTTGSKPVELTDEYLNEKLSTLETAPVMFQEYVPGNEVRAYVVDGELVASVSTDFEYGEKSSDVTTHSELYDCSDEVEEVILDVAKVLGLPYATVELKVEQSNNGEKITVLEANEAGRFMGYEHRHENVDIASPLVDYLLDE